MRIVPLCSGSSANSTFIGSSDSGILIDIGCNYKSLREYLSICGIELSAIKAVLITHEHTDHIAGLRVFSKNNPDIPVYTSRGTGSALAEKGCVGDFRGLDEIENAGINFKIEAFRTPHDCAESVGFTITCTNGYRLAYLTDLGEITPGVRDATLGSDFAFIESNYDSEMLWGGSYQYFLKQRIDSQCGHLSNTASTQYIQELIRNGATRVVLAHLSRQNNSPQLAYSSAVSSLAEAGVRLNRDYTLDVAKVRTTGECIAV
jgi:phosphoribosyl 1,2-cyclic phosphodiesterase